MAAGVSAAKVGEWGVGPSGHHGRVPRDKGWTLHDVRTLAKEVGALSKLHLAAFEKTEKTGGSVKSARDRDAKREEPHAA